MTTESLDTPLHSLVARVLDHLRHPHPERIAHAKGEALTIAQRLGYIRQAELARGMALLGPQLRGGIDAALVLAPATSAFKGFRLTQTRQNDWTATVRFSEIIFTENSIDPGAALMAALLILRAKTEPAPSTAAA